MNHSEIRSAQPTYQRLYKRPKQRRVQVRLGRVESTVKDHVMQPTPASHRPDSCVRAYASPVTRQLASQPGVAAQASTQRSVPRLYATTPRSFPLRQPRAATEVSRSRSFHGWGTLSNAISPAPSMPSIDGTVCVPVAHSMACRAFQSRQVNDKRGTKKRGVYPIRCDLVNRRRPCLQRVYLTVGL